MIGPGFRTQHAVKLIDTQMRTRVQGRANRHLKNELLKDFGTLMLPEPT
jgi:hypothetical protein